MTMPQLITKARAITFAAALLLTSAAALDVAAPAAAQTFERGNYVVAVTHRLRVPADGSLREALEVASEWGEKVLKKHPMMGDVRYLLSADGAEPPELLVLYEYVTTNGDADAITEELKRQAWPEDDAWQAFEARLRKYIDPDENVRARYREILIISSSAP